MVARQWLMPKSIPPTWLMPKREIIQEHACKKTATTNLSSNIVGNDWSTILPQGKGRIAIAETHFFQQKLKPTVNLISRLIFSLMFSYIQHTYEIQCNIYIKSHTNDHKRRNMTRFWSSVCSQHWNACRTVLHFDPNWGCWCLLKR